MHELMAEAHRLSKDIGRITTQAPVESEIPLRLHSREVDAGGAPEFHPSFLKYLGNASVCNCGRQAICAPNCHFNRDRVLGHLPECEPACIADTRYRASKHKNSPSRMKRALRQVRALNPKAYDFVYLVVARHYSFEQAVEALNADNFRRGKPALTHAQYAVLWVSGASMLASSF